MHGWVVFIVVVAAFIAVGWGLQAYTNKTGRMKGKGNPKDYDDPMGGWG